jgi:hypothetical protein
MTACWDEVSGLILIRGSGSPASPMRLMQTETSRKSDLRSHLIDWISTGCPPSVRRRNGTTLDGAILMTTYSNQSNARRAADKMISDGTAPAASYEIRPDADGRFAIAWPTTGPTTDHVESEIAATTAAADAAPPPPAAGPAATDGEEPGATATVSPAEPEDKFPAGTRVILQGAIVGRIDAEHFRVALDGASEALAIPEAALQPGKTPRTGRVAKAAGEPRRSKAREADELAATGVMPTKPDVSSHANHHYQKRFDRLAELVAADDWNGVADYQCTGVNTYATMVRQYRDRLLAAHRAQMAT